MHHRLSHATRKVILVAVAALAILVAATVGVVTASTTGIIFACVNVSSGTIHIVMPLDTSTSSSSSSASTATATTTTTGTAGTGTAGTATTTSTTGTISTGTGTTGTVSTGTSTTGTATTGTSTSGTTTTGTSTSGTTTTGTSTSGTATTGTTTAGTSTSGTGAGPVMAQVAVSPKAGPNPCAQNEVLLSWNTDGGTGGPTGPTGPTGPQGPTGAAGTGLAYHTESRVPVSIPTSFTSILHLDVPEGSYVVAATVLANNLGFTRVPVLCAITSPSDSGVISGVQLEPEVPQTEGRASGATLPVGLATTLPSGGRIDLQCQSNTGPAGATAQADQMQLTASTVTGIVRQ